MSPIGVLLLVYLGILLGVRSYKHGMSTEVDAGFHVSMAWCDFIIVVGGLLLITKGY